MIRYQLLCAHDHSFEAWFKDSAAYDEQVAYGEVQCPYCGNLDIRKAVMAPAVQTGKTRDAQTEHSTPEPQEIAIQAAEKAADDMRGGMDPQEAAQQFLEVVHTLKTHVSETCEDVGDQFAEEVRAIHYGDAEERGIYGKATLEDPKELVEEGIDVLPLPDFGDKDKAN